MKFVRTWSIFISDARYHCQNDTTNAKLWWTIAAMKLLLAIFLSFFLTFHVLCIFPNTQTFNLVSLEFLHSIVNNKHISLSFCRGCARHHLVFTFFSPYRFVCVCHQAINKETKTMKEEARQTQRYGTKKSTRTSIQATKSPLIVICEETIINNTVKLYVYVYIRFVLIWFSWSLNDFANINVLLSFHLSSIHPSVYHYRTRSRKRVIKYFDINLIYR